MKTLLLPSRALLVPVAFALTASLHAQSNAARTPPPLGLLRLKSEARTGDAAPVAAAKFSVDELSTSGVAGASKAKKNNVDYIALDNGKEWARPIRGNARDVTFVSFQVYASQSTIIDIAGARLGLTVGPVTGALQLMFDDSTTGALQWKSLNYHVSTGKYDGRSFAALTTMTVRLDPEAGTWDVYSGSRLLAEDLPLIEAKKSDRRISVRAGIEGAWITGLVLSDENPIYEDVNANAIDDRFELSQRGQLLSAKAPASERHLLITLWKNAQRSKPPKPFSVKRPSPDNLTSGIVPKS